MGIAEVSYNTFSK